MAEPRPSSPGLRLLRCNLQSLADVPQLRAPEGQRLRVLHLHGNALSTVQGLDSVCPCLEELTLSSNDLQDLEGLQQLHRLRFLDVSCNCLSSLQGLESLSLLKELRAAYNQISQLSDFLSFAKPSQLKLLDLRDNGITHLGQLLFLGAFPLEDLRFQSAGGRRGNPICKEPGYRSAVLRAAPDLQYLDEEMLESHERDELPPAAAMVLPDTWPPRPRDSEQAAIHEAQQELLFLQEERQQHMEAVAETGAALASQESASAAFPFRKDPKISQQMQQELKLVAAEAKRRQAMNRELKVKLSQTLQKLQQSKESEQSLRLKLTRLQSRSQLLRLKHCEASVAVQSFQEEFSLAQSEREENAARRSQEIFQADEVLAATEEETQALALARRELHQRQTRQLRLKDELQQTREALDSWTFTELPAAQKQLQRGRSRCFAEAAAGEAAMRSSEEAGKLLAQHLEVKAAEAEEQKLLRREAEEQIRSVELKAHQQRLMLEEEVRHADTELKELHAERHIEDQRKARERQEVEHRFKEHHAALAVEAKSLQAEMQSLRAEALEEDLALRGYTVSTEESQQEEVLLEAALCQANAEEMEVQEQFVAEDAAFKKAQEALQLAEAELSQQESQFHSLQASLRRDFVPGQLLEEEQQFVQSLKQEQVLAARELQSIQQEEQEAAESLMSSSPERVREELTQLQAKMRSVSSEFQQADTEMDALQQQIQSLQAEVATQQEARVRRDADWQRADAEVGRRVQKALAQEESAFDTAEALQEELAGLKQELEHYDEDITWLEDSVEQATAAWSSMPFEHVEHLEAENRRQAQQAEEQLSSMGVALSKELQKHREANQSLGRLVQSEEEELQGYATEEKLMQDAWDEERQALAEEAATVAAELQRLASGL